MTESTRENREFVELVLRCLDGLGGPEELDALEEQLRSDAEKVKLYNDLCLQSQLLEDDAAPSPPMVCRAETGRRRGAFSAMWRWRCWAVAGALVLGIAAGVTLGWFRDRPDGLDTANRTSPATHDDVFLATLSEVGRDVVWSDDHDMPVNEDQGLGKGWMQLDVGTIEIVFRSGATVRLEGPAMFGIDSCLRGSLEFGNIEVYAPESASDFTVHTSLMDVVDLGTRYSMRVDEDTGRADVSVSEGRVDLHLGNAGRRTRIYSLTGGQSASVSTVGGIIETTGRAIEDDSRLDGLVAHWSFDGIDGQLAEGQRIEDASPNALHGRFLRWKEHNECRAVPGVDSNALDLSDFGAVDLSEHLDRLGALSSFTITAWVRNPKNMIFSISDATDRHRVQFERSGDLLYYGWQNDRHWDAVRAMPNGGWNHNQWYHVAVTVNDQSVTLYRDGQILIGPCSTGVLLGTPVQRPIDLARKNCALIGKADRSRSGIVRQKGWKPSQFLAGEIDDLQIYNRSLKADAIRYLYANPGESFPRISSPPTLPGES